MALSSKTRVGVLRGGPSREYDVSVKTGAHVLKHLPDASYTPVDIFIDRDGVWHVNGIVETPAKVFKKADVFFNALHGEFGEDGTVQNIMDTFGVPYTGSGRLASTFAMHKAHAKKVLKEHGIKSPFHKIIKKSDLGTKTTNEALRLMPIPAIVKPIALGSSLGISVVKRAGEMFEALEKAFALSPTVLIEEYIVGREATCGVLDSFRGSEAYALLPAECVYSQGADFLDYEGKYGGGGKVVHPGRFSENEKHALQELARKVHKGLGLRHYSRSDFIVTPRRGIYFLEVNTLPGLAADAPFTGALDAIGLSFPAFLNHVVQLALSRK